MSLTPILVVIISIIAILYTIHHFVIDRSSAERYMLFKYKLTRIDRKKFIKQILIAISGSLLFYFSKLEMEIIDVILFPITYMSYVLFGFMVNDRIKLPNLSEDEKIQMERDFKLKKLLRKL